MSTIEDHLRTLLAERNFDLDTLERDAAAVETVLASDAEVARELGDAPTIVLTSARNETAHALRKAAREAIEALDRGERLAALAEGALVEADAIVGAGTLDGRAALKAAAELTVALAAARAHRRHLPALREAVRKPLAQLANMARDAQGRARAAVLKSTLAISDSLFNPDNDSSWARATATTDGTRADPSVAAWFPLCDELARRAFAAKKAAAREHFRKNFGNADIKRMRIDPDPADLEAALECRRTAYASARAARRAELEAIQRLEAKGA